MYNTINMIYDFQKASILKRISAFLLDFILIVILATFFAFMVSLITKYSDIVKDFQGFYTQYENIYNISLTDPELFKTYNETQLATYTEAIEAMNADKEVIKCWNLVSSIPIVMVSVGLFFAIFIVEFILPIVLKNGQTVGKKVFRIGVINENGVTCTKFQLFARAMLGKCAVEYMIPAIIFIMMILGTIGIVGPLVIVALLILQIVVMIIKPTNPMIHDLVANTAVCDLSTQKVFDTYEDMVAFIEKINKEKAESELY